MKKITVAVAMLSFAVLAQTPAEDKNLEELKARIAPVGQVYLAGSEPVAAKPTGPRTGEQIYQGACFACHATGALDAPKKGDAAAWEPRLKQGMPTLVKHVTEGFNAMPPRGICMDCTAEDYQAVIEWMSK